MRTAQDAYDGRLLAALRADPRHEKHGSRTGYRAGCRCGPCRDAHAARERHYTPVLDGPGRDWRKVETSADRNELLSRYRNWLFYVAHQMAPERSQVDDVAQEGYIAMWRAMETFDPARGSLPSWLTKNARMRMVEYLKRGAPFGKPESRGVHTTASSVGAVQGSLDELVADGFDPASAHDVVESVFTAYMQGEVCWALQELTELQRRYVVLRFWHGLTEGEMYARQLFPPGTVVRNLWAGKAGAKRVLEQRLAHLATTGG